MLGDTARQERDEARAVAEHAQVAQLVRRDGLERGWRGEGEPPAERQVALARTAPPAAGRVPDRDPVRGHAERRRMAGDGPLEVPAGALAQPRVQERGPPAGGPPAP